METAVVYDFMERKRMVEQFKFSSRKQYEDELARLILLTSNPRKKKNDPDYEKQYEEVMEEYLRFSAQDDA
ncbi:MAG: hypothetical protein ACYDHY_07485 [Acidiferrobacterales bacterium]